MPPEAESPQVTTEPSDFKAAKADPVEKMLTTPELILLVLTIPVLVVSVCVFTTFETFSHISKLRDFQYLATI